MSWAGALRRAGGAVVLWESDAARHRTPGGEVAAAGRRVREEGVRERPLLEGRVRALTLVAGKIAGDRIISDGGW